MGQTAFHFGVHETVQGQDTQLLLLVYFPLGLVGATFLANA